MCTIWKGLSLIDAERLLQLHQIFKKTLQELIADQMRMLDRTFRQQQLKSTPSDRSSDPATFCSRLIFSRSELIDSMVHPPQESPEFFGNFETGDFEKLLPFYLASCDYLVDVEPTGSQNTAIDL